MPSKPTLYPINDKRHFYHSLPHIWEQLSNGKHRLMNSMAKTVTAFRTPCQKNTLNTSLPVFSIITYEVNSKPLFLFMHRPYLPFISTFCYSSILGYISGKKIATSHWGEGREVRDTYNFIFIFLIGSRFLEPLQYLSVQEQCTIFD